jgi:hypothetical protein
MGLQNVDSREGQLSGLRATTMERAEPPDRGPRLRLLSILTQKGHPRMTFCGAQGLVNPLELRLEFHSVFDARANDLKEFHAELENGIGWDHLVALEAISEF